MPDARIKFSGQEMVLGDRLVTCGRVSDNDIAFADDSNVSRYHVEIEPRGSDYWIIDLNSSNGTTVNGEKLTGERLLVDGDQIVLGGSAEMEFLTGAVSEADTSDEPAADSAAAAASGASGLVPTASIPSNLETGGIATEAAVASKGSKNLLLIAGILCCVALLCVVGSAAAYYFSGKSGCDAKATITKPEAGDTIANPTEIEVKAENTGCVAKVVFILDENVIASADSEPYTATLDPKDFPDLADGLDHSLQIVLIDQDGKQIPQPNPVPLAFETRAIAKPSPTTEVASGNTNQQGQQQGNQGSANVSLLETQQMTTNIVKQFHGGFTYNLSNKQFLQEVQRMIPQYVQEGYFDRAAAYRDAINVAYVREQNLDAMLGFMLAMSRSKFTLTKQGDNEGLWQMSSAFVTSNGYNGLCGTETLSDSSQNCAAKASALYMKALVYGVFDGDEVYAAAAFGKSPADASAWKATLPANRSDVWNVIKTAPEREQLVRFFAAAIVTENPQKFGLKKDHPLSELYRVTQ
ncbi:MAG TPA: FHA domain-containing protein [Pyrinomonadaceae bacterium]|nr:FHA domain-containing protein [Pyrinomonadaceae bacterium]